MNDYSRSDYLKALIAQKKSLNASSSLVNPSIPQSNNIGDLAALDTSFNSQPQMPEQPKSDANNWQRFMATVKEFSNNINEGVLGFVDGIIDLGGYAYGAISGDHEGAQNFMNADWETIALNYMNQIYAHPLEMMNREYWENWGSVFDYDSALANKEKVHQDSFTSEMGEGARNTYNAITQGIGSALPSVLLGIATGGASWGAQAAMYGTLGASAFGNAASESLNEGASYGQAAGYGAISAGLEIAIENFSKGINGFKALTSNGAKAGAKKITKEVLEETTKKGFKEIAKATIKDMAGEGMEEVFTDLLDPLAKLTYKGKDALQEYDLDNPEFYADLLNSFVGGAAGALVGGKVTTAANVSKYTQKGVEILEDFNQVDKLQKELNSNLANGAKASEMLNDYAIKQKELAKDGFTKLNELRKTNPEAFKKVVQALDTNINKKTAKDNDYTRAVENLKTKLDTKTLQQYVNDVGGQVSANVKMVEDSAFQNAEAFQKATGRKLTQSQIEQFDSANIQKEGLRIDGDVYISEAYADDVNQLIMEEAISHGYLDSNPELRDNFIRNIRANKELNKKLNEIQDTVMKDYGLSKSEIADIKNPNTTLKSETMAKFMRFLYSDNNISPLLNSLNKSNLSSILSRSIRYLKSKGSSTAKARLELEKLLSKIKNNEIKNTETIKFSEKSFEGYTKEEKSKLEKEIKISDFQKQSFSKQIDLYLENKMSSDENFYLGVTPKILIKNGASEHKLVMSQKAFEKIRGIGEGKHHIPVEIVKQIPEAMEKPLLVLKGSQKNSLVEILELKDDLGRELLVAIKLDASEKEYKVTRVPTVYGKEGLESYLKNHSNDVIDMYNEKKTSNWLSNKGLQLSKFLNNSSFTYSISEINKNSNGNTEKTKNTFSTASQQTTTNTPFKFVSFENGQNIVFNGGRAIVYLELPNGQRMPFYQSSGSNPKQGVTPGQWYPIFGYFKDSTTNSVINHSWINKGSSVEMSNYHNSKALKAACEYLNSTLGTVKVEKDTISDKDINLINENFSIWHNVFAKKGTEQFFKDLKKNGTKLDEVPTKKLREVLSDIDFLSKYYLKKDSNKLTDDEIRSIFNKALKDYNNFTSKKNSAIKAFEDAYNQLSVNNQNNTVASPKATSTPKEAKKVETTKEVKQQTTNATPQAVTKVYSDFFNQDGTISAEWVKRGARANYGNIIDIKESKQMIELAVAQIANGFVNTPNIKIDQINKVARTFFEKYNVSDGTILRNQAFDYLVEELLKCDITIERKIKVDGSDKEKVLKEKLNIGSFVQDKAAYKAEMTGYLKDIVKYFGEKSKITKVYEKFAKFRENLLNLNKQIIEEANNKVETQYLITEIINIEHQIDKKFSEKTIKARYGVHYPEIPFIRKLAKGIRTNQNLKSITPSSINNIVQHFKEMNYEPNSATLEALHIEFNPEWYKMYKYFEKEQKKETVTDKKTGKTTEITTFPNRKLELEEVEMINSFMKDMKKVLNNVVKEETKKTRAKLSKATTELNVLVSKVDPNKKASFIMTEFDKFSSPDIRLRRMFGNKSDIVKIVYDDQLSAYIKARGVTQGFVNDFYKLAEKHKIKTKFSNKLNDKVKITLDGVEYTITNNLLLDMYLQSRADENRKHLKESGYSFTYKGRKTQNIKFTDEMIADVESKLTPELKAFADEVLEYYNTTLKEYARNAGISVLDGQIYYPLSRSDVNNKAGDSLMQQFKAMNPDTLPINQQRTESSKGLHGMAIDERFAYYASQVARIGEMSEAAEAYSKFINTMVYDDGGNKVSRNELMKRIDPEWDKWKEYLEHQFLGIPLTKGYGTGKFMGNLAASTLGWNISTILKQTASIPTILTEVHFSSWLKSIAGIKNIGEYRDLKQKLIEASPLLRVRFSTNEASQAQALTEQLNKISKFFMLPVEGMDEAIILTFCFQAAQYEAQLEGYTDLKSDENFNRAVQILEQIVLNTQSNAVAPKMSMARSGYGNFFRKTFSYFTSDLNNIINKISLAATTRKTALKNIEAIEKRIPEVEAKMEQVINDLEEQIANTTDAKEIEKLENKLEHETEKFDIELENLKKMLEDNKILANGKEQAAAIGKLLAVLFMKALMIAGISQLVARLYGRKGWKENTLDEFGMDLLFESTIYNLPYIQTIANTIEYDKDLGNFELQGINDILTTTVSSFKEITSGDPNGYKIAYNTLTSLGQITGIPFKNIYNLVFGAWKNFDESGFEVDGLIKGYSDTYISSQFKESIAAKHDNKAKGYLEILMKNNKVSSTTTRVSNELISLTKDGYSVLPKNYMLGYTDETTGKQVKLSNQEINSFRTVYNTSNKAVEELMNVTEYRTLTSEEKAKLIKKTYDIYYSYARAKVLKTSADSKLANLLLYTNGRVNISKYMTLLNTISSIKESKTKSRKELVFEYVNKLYGLSKQEKLLVLHLAGYKNSDMNKNILSKYLSQNGMDLQEVNTFLGVE